MTTGRAISPGLGLLRSLREGFLDDQTRDEETDLERNTDHSTETFSRLQVLIMLFPFRLTDAKLFKRL